MQSCVAYGVLFKQLCLRYQHTDCVFEGRAVRAAQHHVMEQVTKGPMHPGRCTQRHQGWAQTPTQTQTIHVTRVTRTRRLLPAVVVLQAVRRGQHLTQPP